MSKTLFNASDFVATDAIQSTNVTFITAKGYLTRSRGMLNCSRAVNQFDENGNRILSLSSVNGKAYLGGKLMPKEAVRELDLNKVAYSIM